VKPKRGRYVVFFFNIGLCWAVSFKRSRRELSIVVAEHRFMLKNYQNTNYTRFFTFLKFYFQQVKHSPKWMFSFNCVLGGSLYHQRAAAPGLAVFYLKWLWNGVKHTSIPTRFHTIYSYDGRLNQSAIQKGENTIFETNCVRASRFCQVAPSSRRWRVRQLSIAAAVWCRSVALRNRISEPNEIKAAGFFPLYEGCQFRAVNFFWGWLHHSILYAW